MVEATLRLFILRHGKSDWSTGQPDFGRPLAERGRTAARKVGSWMKEQGMMPDKVICSPARRARETAESVCRTLGIAERGINFDERIYGGSIAEMLACLADHAADARQVLLVGHNPGLEELVDFLTQGQIMQPDDGKLLPTAALAELRPLTGWRSLGPRGAELLAITRPGEM
jgi:phosphohistidine phosphatase